MERGRMFVLELVYDDSDSMTDYYSPDAGFLEWFVSAMPGKHVTERKMRNAVQTLPAWIRKFEWEYGSTWWGSKWLRQKGWFKDLSVEGYGGGDRSMQFLLRETTTGIYEMNNDYKQKVPASYEELARLVAEKKEDRRRRTEGLKAKAVEAHIKTIQSAHAMIGANGFEMLTPEVKKREIEKTLNEAIREKTYRLEKKKLYYRSESDGKLHLDIDRSGRFGLQFADYEAMRNAVADSYELVEE